VIALGIDIGTTHTKVVALDAERGTVLERETAATPVRRDGDGEQRDALEVVDLVAELVRRVADRLRSPDAVAALSVASVGEEVVLLDGSGVPTGETIAWYDPRGLEHARAFADGAGGDVLLSRRWPPDRTFSLFKLMWMQEHRLQEYQATVTWTDLGDFVLHRLGGELVMDWSHASRAGAFDIVARAWDRETIAAAGLALGFPRLVPSGQVIGRLDPRIADRLGLSPDVALVSGGHDHLVAAFGAGVRSTAELFLSAGTSEAHLALLDEPLETGLGPDRVDVGCYVDDHSWYAHVNIHSGHFFRQWRDLLYPGVADDKMYAELEAASSAGIAFVTADDQRRGRLEGVPYDAERAALMRAVLEGLAHRSAGIIDQLERVSGSPFELVLVAGHPTRVPFWRTLREAAYRRPMASVDEREPTAFGAAVLAARAVAGTEANDLVARRTMWAESPLT
jgi:sugar (pentulose or hexulose) kinase